MSEKNVIALASLLCERHTTADEGDLRAGFCPECYVDAEALAARGVLAAESLSDEDAERIESFCGCYEGNLNRVRGDARPEAIDLLQRIARGQGA